nr:MFS transporter [Bacteroidales bacterium]
MDAYAALKIKDFRSFISGRFLLTFATQMQSIVVGWQVYELTKDPLSLGLVGLAEAIPFLTIALYAGHLADVAKRKTVILLTNILLILCSAAFCIFNFFIDSIFKSYGAMPIFIVMIFVGLSRGMIYPSIMGLLAQLVPKELYPNSSTWNSLIWHIAAVSGPAIGGLIYAYFGVGSAYLGVLAVYSLSFIF